MRFTNSFLEEIRERIPIADVIGRRVTFDRKKSNPSKGDFWANCPFLWLGCVWRPFPVSH